MLNVEDIKAKVRAGKFRFSQHADMAAEANDLDVAQVVEAILRSEVLEQYPDTGRGKSCLLVGFSGETPIHTVCGMRADNVIVVTVYIPGPPKFSDPWTRQGAE
jgi:hypothetical protein